MTMNSKFLTVFEAVYQRYQHGGLEVGDYVKFIDKFKSHKEYKELSDAVKDSIDNMQKTGLKMRVVLTKSCKPGLSQGNNQNIGQYFSADIALDHSGGRLTDYLTVPAGLLEVINDYPNLNKLADSQRKKDKIDIKPVEVEVDQDHYTRRSDAGNGKIKPSQTELPTKNTVLKHQSKLTPYTKSYMS